MVRGGVSSGPVSGPQHHGGGGQIPARVEGVLHRETQPAQVAAVDLSQAQIEIGAANQKSSGGLSGLCTRARLTRQRRRAVHPDRQGIEPAFHIGDRGDGLGRDAGGASLGEREHGGQIEHDAPPSAR